MLLETCEIPKRFFHFFSFVVIFFSTIVFAHVDKNFGHLEQMLSKYKNVQTLRAEFVQKQKNATLGQTKISSGTIFIKRPGSFRWDTQKPEPSEMVSNGKKVWFYSAPFRKGERGQVLIRNATDVQSKVAIDLLSGHADLKKDFKIKALKESFLLRPLRPIGDLDQIELFLESTTNLVYKIRLITKLGNETELTLQNVTLGPTLPDSLFEFRAPENIPVDVQQM